MVICYIRSVERSLHQPSTGVHDHEIAALDEPKHPYPENLLHTISQASDLVRIKF
jgi:hypothetical protein